MYVSLMDSLLHDINIFICSICHLPSKELLFVLWDKLHEMPLIEKTRLQPRAHALKQIKAQSHRQESLLSLHQVARRKGAKQALESR